MKSGLSFPFDALSQVMQMILVRLAVLFACIPVGLAIGTFCAHGFAFSWEKAFGHLGWAGIAWLISPSYLFVNLSTLVALIIAIKAEAVSALIATYALLVLCWAWLAFVWA